MTQPDFRVGYLYSLAPIHCGGEGDLGNILEIAREAHTNFPYIPGSSLRGSLRNEVTLQDPEIADTLFGRELQKDSQMGIHQVWFGDARLLWVPMRTMSLKGGGPVFSWVSCHSLLRDHALLSRNSLQTFPDHPIGTRPGRYIVADAEVKVEKLPEGQSFSLAGDWPATLQGDAQTTWNSNRIILSDSDFQVLMEHSLWTQIRNKIQEDSEGANQAGSAEVFWTDVCIPRDTILYFAWGYSPLPNQQDLTEEHKILINVLQGLFQVGGQANVGRGWVQGWVSKGEAPTIRNTHEIATGVK
jgi:CRISPR-associated protein Cmr4